MKIGYARVSTVDKQTLDSQIHALKKLGVQEENLYTEKGSGMKTDRPVLNEILYDGKTLRKGDELVFYKMDRISRSTKHMLEIAEHLEKIGVEMVSISDNIDTTTPGGRAMFKMFAVINELERDIIAERTRAGLEAARARGRKGGRPKVDEDKVKYAVFLYNQKKHTIKEIEEMAGVSKSVLYRAIR